MRPPTGLEELQELGISVLRSLGCNTIGMVDESDGSTTVVIGARGNLRPTHCWSLKANGEWHKTDPMTGETILVSEKETT
jgi:hypothetical protein